jgi:hypothetical protein
MHLVYSNCIAPPPPPDLFSKAILKDSGYDTVPGKNGGPAQRDCSIFSNWAYDQALRWTAVRKKRKSAKRKAPAWGPGRSRNYMSY